MTVVDENQIGNLEVFNDRYVLAEVACCIR